MNSFSFSGNLRAKSGTEGKRGSFGRRPEVDMRDKTPLGPRKSYNIREHFSTSRSKLIQPTDNSTRNNLNHLLTTRYNHEKGVDTYRRGDGSRNIGDNGHDSIQVKQHEDL